MIRTQVNILHNESSNRSNESNESNESMPGLCCDTGLCQSKLALKLLEAMLLAILKKRRRHGRHVTTDSFTLHVVLCEAEVKYSQSTL